jgi:hypothetical protein
VSTLFPKVLEANIVDFLSLAIGAIGLALAVIFYLKARRYRRISFAARSFGLVTDATSSLPNFSFQFKNKPLANLTALKVLLWNSGSELITGEDFARTDRLRIELPNGVDVLDARVSSFSTPANLAKASINQEAKNIVDISFEYFARNEGCLLSLLHTGRGDTGVGVKGTLKGTGSPIPWRHRETKIRFWLAIVCFFMVALMIGAWLLAQRGSLSAYAFVLLFCVLTPTFLLGIDAINRIAIRKTGGILERRFNETFSSSDFAE